MAKHTSVKFTLNSNIIYRLAQLPMQASFENSWLQLKESIRLSSPAFYGEIEHLVADDLLNLTGKKKYTLQKYFNRARFRATPYGTFAGIGIFDNTGAGDVLQLIVENHQSIHRFTDWPLKNGVSFSATDLIASNAQVIANSTWYHNGNNIRYVYRNGSKFELSDVAQHPVIKQVLLLTKLPTTLLKLREQLAADCPTDADFEYLVGGMIDLQLLYSEKQPNIIGEDYFTRINIKPKDGKEYIIAKRPYQTGGIDKKLFKHLPALANLFQHLTIKREENGLQRFIGHFIRRYDRQAVPLLEALDPETGIGYDDMEQAYEAAGIASDFVKPQQERGDSPLKLFLAGNLPISGTSEGSAIRLEEYNVPEISNPKPLPNTTSALVEVAGDLVQLVSFNGCTATALAGRFTLADDDIYRHCKAIAKYEQAANYTVLFFDIAYVAEDTVDNVNRRRSIYDYQLTIGNYDTSKEPLSFSDLILFMHRQELVLWSTKHNRRMVPRLATAYNYTRSDLPVFRLLCDLQYQGLTTQFNLQLRTIMPNFPFYPRVQYHNIILSAAAWRLEWSQYKSSGLSLKKYFIDLGVSRFVRTGIGDQTLCIDCHDQESLSLLEHLLEKDNRLYVEETIAPGGRYFVDNEGNSFAGQFLLTLQHSTMIYDYTTPVIRAKSNIEQSNYAPGSKWLYLELYAHPRQFDHLLSQYIKPWLKEHAGLMERWFFIRFNEGGHHIRLRVEMRDKEHLSRLLSSLTEALDKTIVYDIQVKTYKPEIERYGIEMMDSIERHFHSDSQLVLDLVNSAFDDNAKYRLCVLLFQRVQASGIFKPNVFDLWISKNMQGWEQEHKLAGPDFKSLNQHYKAFEATNTGTYDESIIGRYQTFVDSLLDTLMQAEPLARLDLLSNLIHMHVNRMFNYHQRVHEMIVYYFMSKYLDALKRKANASSVTAFE